MKVLKISFEEGNRHIYDTAIIGEDITKEQAQKLIKKGIAYIEDIPDDELTLRKGGKK